MTALKHKFLWLITMKLTDVRHGTVKGFGPSCSEILKLILCTTARSFTIIIIVASTRQRPPLGYIIIIYQVAHGMGTSSGQYGTKLCQTGQ